MNELEEQLQNQQKHLSVVEQQKNGILIESETRRLLDALVDTARTVKQLDTLLDTHQTLMSAEDHLLDSAQSLMDDLKRRESYTAFNELGKYLDHSHIEQ